MDRFTPENRYIVTYEGLTDDEVGGEVTKGLNEFLGKAEGVTPIVRESVPCVWRAVVKGQPPEKQQTHAIEVPPAVVAPPPPNAVASVNDVNMVNAEHPPLMQQFQLPFTAGFHGSNVEQMQGPNLRRRLDPAHQDSQRKGPDYPRPYTLDQLDKMMKMLKEVAGRYNNEAVHDIMMEYHAKVAVAKAELGGEVVAQPPPPQAVDTTGIAPLQLCDRAAPISLEQELQVNQEYAQCPILDGQLDPKDTTIVLLKGYTVYGRTGNNLIEFMHALQYQRENDVVIGVMLDSWVTKLITSMWMAFPTDNLKGGFMDEGIQQWKAEVERAFCIKIFVNDDELSIYQNVIETSPKEMFQYKHQERMLEYVRFQMHNLRTLFRSYNRGFGVNIKNERVGSMCSVLDAIFGDNKSSAIYSVIHSRSLEGDPGLRLLKRISDSSGCDPLAALEMKPEYIKAILTPLGLLEHPILFISDHQNPEILERLLADPDIGPKIHLLPDEASWIGGDITAGISANAFIGNPASTFSGFIAKSRMALGFENNFLFRARNENGVWENVCEEKCIFYKVLDCSRNANENSVTCLKFHLVYSHMLYCILPSSGL